MILGIPGNGMVDISTEGNISKYQIIAAISSQKGAEVML